MGEIWRGFVEALKLIGRFDPYVVKVTLFTLYVCAVATAGGTLLGVPLGSALAVYRFRGRKILVTLVNTGMGLPPVVVGLFVFMFLKRRGPLGFLGWLYTPQAIILAEVVLAMPLVAGITLAALQGADPKLRLQAKSLGASEAGSLLTLLREHRLSLVAAVIAGFGGVISEVGAVMLVGGNIEGSTRTLTTAIVLETRKGNFELAIALGIILLALSFMANVAMLSLQGKRLGE